ncbi:MAG: helix-turn-helix domain-containing protein [Oligoflexia bacterium]|nr:helix-turn-helix domain-containing protein [Oligoflexia bacterium]
MKKKSFLNWQEARRLRGIELFHKGWKQSEIAEALGVSKRAVFQWIQKYKCDGLCPIFNSAAISFMLLNSITFSVREAISLASCSSVIFA